MATAIDRKGGSQTTMSPSVRAVWAAAGGISLCSSLIFGVAIAFAKPSDGMGADELLRQQQHERVLREQQEQTPDVRLQTPQPGPSEKLPASESPCFVIHHIRLEGEMARRFRWALQAADPTGDPATGQCLGTRGVNVVMTRIQNALIAAGYVTTRVRARPQDLSTGELILNIVPGRIRNIRFARGTASKATRWNAVPTSAGDLLNLRNIEQALENFNRVPSATAHVDIQPAQATDAKPGDSDLVIHWKQARPIRFMASLDDAGSRATGKYQASATVFWDDPLHLNDLFYASMGHAVFNGSGKGTVNYNFHYTVPLGFWRADVNFSRYDYHQTVPGYIHSYVYSGTSHNAELKLTRLLYRDATRKISAFGDLWRRSSHNYIDDTEIKVQRRRTAGWELGMAYRQFIGPATLDLRASYRRGTGAFGALHAPEEAYGEGTSRSRIYKLFARLDLPFELWAQQFRYTGSWRAQLSSTPLVPQDRFAIGGRYTVRGFDGELFLTGDHGWVLRNDLGWNAGHGQELYVGLDTGHVGGQSTRWQLGRRLTGGVVGLRGGYRHLSWNAFVGTPIQKPKGFQTDSVTTGFRVSAAF